MHSYPKVAHEMGLTRSGPVITHGRLAPCTDKQLACLGDYMGFPGSSGGAVMCDGKFMGTHIEAISHDERGDTSRPDVAATMPSCERGEELEELDEPLDRPAAATTAAGGSAAMAEGTAPEQSEEADVVALLARVDALEVNEPHKSALSLFTPWHVVDVGLQLAGICPPQSGQAQVKSALEMATALAGRGEGARKRGRGH
ncbi:hypothetical protein HXX76_012914 [Chlamydomonas incerta]|uniref:Uncharacterized protein n=1 Tax=Chlamydomonas incerta TaxID=51695 RepID=A0A835VUR5_CHLIN|nr:hypothetical protein HXX76_012914 [Chlamydomonas incerta]|eukprot:KAG2426598.1 hypothetical protein HXX76_012914 [Chlamydomonas incerta]